MSRWPLALVAFGSFVAFQLGLCLLYGIVGQGVALCRGRVGILPLGRSLFFGLGACLGGRGASCCLSFAPWARAGG